ncbi:MAG TPA: tetratricopeptide repeat protein, partial [Chthoniobacteraceae bacterium]|nr:tetratricopeptide repeat protein [Chthoniobacteraceae bacterium]
FFSRSSFVISHFSSLALLLFASAAPAAEPALLASARRALGESAPQIAIEKIHAWLASASPAAPERDATQQLLAQAQLAAGLHDEALATIEPLAASGNPAARLLKASAFAAAGRWFDALPLFQEAARRPDAPLSAKLGEAESLQALGRVPEAVEVLEIVVKQAPKNVTAQLRLAALYVELQKLKRARALLETLKPAEPGDVKWKQYVEGRMLLADERPAPALAKFEEVTRYPSALSEGLLAAASIGAGDARGALYGWDAADRPLETFIWQHPDNAWLEVVFRRLDQIYAQQQTPTEGELQRWAQKQQPRCAALARFYVARMQVRAKRSDKAAWSLQIFVDHYPNHPLLPEAHLMRADLLIEKRDLDGAVRALDAAERAVRGGPQRGEIELRRGLVLFQQRQYLLAVNEFQRAALHSPKLRDNATYDAALAALFQQNYDRFLGEYIKLTTNTPDSPLRPGLILEEGLMQARAADPRAEETLQLFRTHFPLSSRQPEARLALAELAYQAGRTSEAAEYLRVSNPSAEDSATSERREYLEIFLVEADAASGKDKVIARANEFIRNHPKSALLSEVRMKLGQIYFNSGNLAAAETQFVTLAQESPASEHAETALFLAGQSAMQSINPGAVDRALKLFDEVVKRNGPLKLYARQQQAIVQAKLGHENEAVTLYDAILSAQP